MPFEQLTLSVLPPIGGFLQFVLYLYLYLLFSPFEIANDNSLRLYLEENVYDPWKGTPLEGYVFLGTKTKGSYGERFISNALERLYGLDIQPPENTGHDRIVGGIKTEFKFTVAHRDSSMQRVKVNCFAVNHVSFGKDWERMVICAINPIENDSHLVYITKDDFIAEMALDAPLFKRQQGGKNSDNDDFFLRGITDCLQFFQRPYIKTLDLW